MIIARQHDEATFLKNSVVSVGSFDGVHRAHQALLEEVVRRARLRNGRSVAVTFEPHPKQVLEKGKQEIALLTTLDERMALCEAQGIDLFYVIEFTYEFSRLSFREFYRSYVIEGLGVSEVVEGYDHHFGRDREGNIEELLSMGKEFEFSVTALKPVYVGDEIVSSTKIRQYLADGNVEKVASFLGRSYSMMGRVVHGDARGKSLGYPTANIVPTVPSKLLPGNGIYFVQVSFNEALFYGMASIGVRPTFGPSEKRTTEVFLLGFSGDLYGRELTVQFLRRLRDEMKFDSPADLILQMDRDKAESMKLVEEYSKVLTGLQKKSMNH